MGFSEPRALLVRRESVGRQDRTVVRAAEALVQRGRGVVLRTWGRGCRSWSTLDSAHCMTSAVPKALQAGEADPDPGSSWSDRGTCGLRLPCVPLPRDGRSKLPRSPE